MRPSGFRLISKIARGHLGNLGHCALVGKPLLAIPITSAVAKRGATHVGVAGFPRDFVRVIFHRSTLSFHAPARGAKLFFRLGQPQSLDHYIL